MVMGVDSKMELKEGSMSELIFEGKVVGRLGVNDDRNNTLTLEVKETKIEIHLKK
jgi:hypothetical protein